MYWTAEVPGHKNWATDQAWGRVRCWCTRQLRFQATKTGGAGQGGVSVYWTAEVPGPPPPNWATDQAQGRVGCRCTGQLSFQDPHELGYRSGAGQGGVSGYWTAEVPGHPNWATDQAQGRVGCRCTGQLRFQAP